MSLILSYITNKNIGFDFSFAIYPIAILGFLGFGFAFLYQYKDVEKITATKSGFIELFEDKLILNYNEEIYYTDVQEIKIYIEGYYNQFIDLMSRNPTPRRSCGLKNTLVLKTKNQTKKVNFLLENKTHLKILKNNISIIRKNNNFNKIELFLVS